jgi:acetyltransferase-like isoleucine patch superfamily enzyme
MGARSKISPQALVLNPQYMELGDDVYVHPYVRLEALDRNPHTGDALSEPRLRLGDRVLINSFSHIGCLQDVVLEDDVGIGSGVTITDHRYEVADPDVPMKQSPLIFAGPVRLKRGAMIGDNTVILGGVTVGANTFIGANSVVNSDIPDLAVAAGAPCRVLRVYDRAKREWVKP